MGQETGNRFSLPFLSIWKEPSPLHDASEKKYEELVLFLSFPFWPFLLSGIGEWNVIEIKVWAPGRQTPSLPLPLSRSKNDCVGHEGFTFALSQSECQGKSRLTFLASGKKKQLRFMSTFCSANQGAEESVPGETFLLFII